MRKFDLTVARAGVSTTSTTGKISTGTPTTLIIKASVQPILRKEMEIDPSLRDRKEAFKLFTDTLLLTADAPTQEADKIEIYGRSFEVVSVDNWQNGIINHVRVVVSR